FKPQRSKCDTHRKSKATLWRCLRPSMQLLSMHARYLSVDEPKAPLSIELKTVDLTPIPSASGEHSCRIACPTWHLPRLLASQTYEVPTLCKVPAFIVG